VRPFMAASQWLWRVWDVVIVDGLVNGIGLTLEFASGMLKLAQTGFVGTYALWIALGVIALFLHFMR
jgi:NADH-quinone oxidoreductase subunit L